MADKVEVTYENGRYFVEGGREKGYGTSAEARQAAYVAAGDSSGESGSRSKQRAVKADSKKEASNASKTEKE